MRILVVIHSLAAGGGERIVADVTRCWAERGHEVAVLTKLGPEHDFFRLDPRVRRHCLTPRGPKWNPLIHLMAILELRKLIRSMVPDVVFGSASGHAALVAAASLGLPCRTIGAEITAPTKYRLPLARHVLRWLSYGWLDALVAETNGTAAWLRRHTRAKRVVVIPKSVRLPLIDEGPAIAPEGVVRGERRVVLAAGRLDPVKDQASLIHAFHNIAARVPDWDLVILGDGPCRPELESLVARLGLQTRVFLPGRAGNMAAWYRRASLFALSSRHEGGPNVLAEALAHGLPAVSFDCDMGPRELIRDGIDGILVPPGDRDALAAALWRLIDDGAARQAMADRAAAGSARFSEAAAMEAWDRLFVSLGADPR